MTRLYGLLFVFLANYPAAAKTNLGDKIRGAEASIFNNFENKEQAPW